MCTEFLRTQKQILLYSCYEYKNVASYYITLSHMETNKAANIINLTWSSDFKSQATYKK